MQTEQIQKVVTTGVNTMGISMAQISAVHGYDTVLYNHQETALQKARRIVELNQEALVLSEELSQAESDAVKARIQLTSGESCLRDCDVVVELIVENMQARHQL